MNTLGSYNFTDDHGHKLELCVEYIDLLKRLEAAEKDVSRLRAVQQWGEEWQSLCRKAEQNLKRLGYYATHTENCAGKGLDVVDEDCTCGLRAILEDK